MKKILIVSNEFYVTKRLEEQYAMFVRAFESRGYVVERRTNAELVYRLSEEGASFGRELPPVALMWDKDVPLAVALELAGVKVFNSARAIEVCDDKVLTHLALAKAGVSVPPTFVVPMSYANIGYGNTRFLDAVLEKTGLPVVFKKARSSYGMDVKLLRSREDVERLIRETREDMLLQTFVEESYGRDLRVNVIGDKAFCAVVRSSDGFCSNVVQGGRMTAATPDEQAAELAVAATKAVGADFAGVDLLFTKDGYTVCEVNTSAHFGTVKQVTGIDLADGIAEYIDKAQH